MVRHSSSYTTRHSSVFRVLCALCVELAVRMSLDPHSEPIRELLHDPVAERIGHVQRLAEDLIEDTGIVRPALLEPCLRLVCREAQVLVEHGAQRLTWPVRIGAAQERR